MVEDSAAGIEGAKKLLLKTFAIMKENTADADICVPSAKELYKIDQLLWYTYEKIFLMIEFPK